MIKSEWLFRQEFSLCYVISKSRHLKKFFLRCLLQTDLLFILYIVLWKRTASFCKLLEKPAEKLCQSTAMSSYIFFHSALQPFERKPVKGTFEK